jgi:hypothetical protein
MVVVLEKRYNNADQRGRRAYLSRLDAGSQDKVTESNPAKARPGGEHGGSHERDNVVNRITLEG